MKRYRMLAVEERTHKALKLEATSRGMKLKDYLELLSQNSRAEENRVKKFKNLF